MIKIVGNFTRNFNIGIFNIGEDAAQGKLFINGYWSGAIGSVQELKATFVII